MSNKHATYLSKAVALASQNVRNQGARLVLPL
ncbi:hypothetical protein JOD43_001507 [Pullulanibacillus pueri]|nr:hypothetical protein [Pullulanibacillus pueri]